MVPSYHPNRRVRADHTVVAVTGNTGLFSKEEIQKQMEQRQKESGKEE